MATDLKVILSHNGVDIVGDEQGLINLTNIWKSKGSDESKAPAEWRRSKQAEEFLSALSRNVNMGISTLWKSRRGKGIAGTWAHWQAALAYAKWLDPTFHQNVNAAFVEWAREARDPELKINRALDRWKQLGRDEEWIARRLKGVTQRRSMCATLADHNCQGRRAYSVITNIGNLACVGKTAKEFLASKGLPESGSTRDHMEKHELAAISFYEAMTEKRIKDVAADGDSECISASRDVAKVVKAAVKALDQLRLPPPTA